jgi:CheY-like chemotaxis protein
MPATTISCSAGPSRNSAHLALIVEYHPWLRLLLGNLLEESGFDVQFASNGATGLRLAARLRPELVVVGASLPELSPQQLIAALESRRVVWGTRVVHVRDLLRRESDQPLHTSRLAVEAGDDEAPAPPVRRTSSGRRRTSVTRQLCHLNTGGRRHAVQKYECQRVEA